MQESIVQLIDVKKIYQMGVNKIYALNGINFTIRQGDFVTIMGTSGSGKSTMLNLIGCLDQPSEGIVMINGTDLSSLNEDQLTEIRRKNIGFIFQQFNLIPTLTTIENIEIPMIFAGVSEKERHIKAMQYLQKANLDAKYANHTPNELSGGQQQRVAIARALANSPPIILADEPTGNLDTKTGTNVMELLRELNSQGTTIIVVTHDPKIVAYSKRNITLRDGEIIDST